MMTPLQARRLAELKMDFDEAYYTSLATNGERSDEVARAKAWIAARDALGERWVEFRDLETQRHASIVEAENRGVDAFQRVAAGWDRLDERR